MSRLRKDFTNAERAEIYVLDLATCCFSGANLWLLDAPLRPGYQRDWADHVRPAARGGKTALKNGVCAPHTFNAKKRHNSADTVYLFERGLPTWRYFDIFGPLTPDQDVRLRRLSRLEKPDWYFNRAIGQILLGFDYRCKLEWYENKPDRKDSYWFKAAFRKITEFQKEVTSNKPLEDRKIIVKPNAIQEAWLELREVGSEKHFYFILEKLFPLYQQLSSLGTLF